MLYIFNFHSIRKDLPTRLLSGIMEEWYYRSQDLSYDRQLFIPLHHVRPKKKRCLIGVTRPTLFTLPTLYIFINFSTTTTTKKFFYTFFSCDAYVCAGGSPLLPTALSVLKKKDFCFMLSQSNHFF